MICLLRLGPRIGMAHSNLASNIFDESVKLSLQSDFLKDSPQFESANSGIEREIRFGNYYQGAFYPGVTSSAFFRLSEIMSRISRRRGSQMDVIVENCRIELQDCRESGGNDRSSYRRITTEKQGKATTGPTSVIMSPKKKSLSASPNRRVNMNDKYCYETQFQRKTRLFTLDLESWGIRFSKSREENISQYEYPVSSPFGVTRFRRRVSYFDRKADSIFYQTRVDLSEIQELSPNSSGNSFSSVNLSRTLYEIEIELLLGESEGVTINLETIATMIYRIFGWMVGATCDEHIINLSNRNYILSRLAMLVYSKDQVTDFSELAIPTSLWNKPVALDLATLDTLVSNQQHYYLTLKYDGKRGYLYINETGIYFCCPPTDIIKIGHGYPEYNGTLLDGEFINGNYYSFDLLFYQGVDFRNHQFLIRYDRLKDLFINHLDQLNTLIVGGNRCHLKPYYTEGLFSDNLSKAFKDLATSKAMVSGSDTSRKRSSENQGPENLRVETDGLIFQPTNLPYYNQATYKYKPLDQLTIDFKVIKDTDYSVINKDNTSKAGEKLNRYRLFAYDSAIRSLTKLVRFTGSNEHPCEGCLYLSHFNGSDPTEKIVECYWDQSNCTFKPLRYRHDRSEPNSLEVALKTYSQFFDSQYLSQTMLCSLFDITIENNMITTPQSELQSEPQSGVRCGSNVIESDNESTQSVHDFDEVAMIDDSDIHRDKRVKFRPE